ncbi:MAG: hypothetical protein JEY96_01560 [Bacteroidales bacterium]|nr:hypothetical protein [Bacteroidales bacterium]
MIEADQALDQDPNSYENIKKLVENDIRNKLGFKELQNFNDTGNFLWKHTILKDHKIRDELTRLKKKYPEKFLNEYVNADKNITRYQSKINNEKFKSEDEKLQFENHIQKYKDKKVLMIDLLNE